MEYGTRHGSRSRVLARDSIERPNLVNFPRGIERRTSTSLVQRFEGTMMKRRLSQVFEDYDDNELFIQHLALDLDMVYEKYKNLEDEFSHYKGMLPYSRQTHSLTFEKMYIELRDKVLDAIVQSDLVLDETSNAKKRLNAELQRKQFEEKTYKQEIGELEEQLYRFASNEKTLNTILKETKEKLNKSNEELNYAKSRLAEADQTAQERSDILPQEFRDLRQRLKKSESSERALSIQLQHSREDLKSIKDELERTQAWLRDALHAHTIKDKRELRNESEKLKSKDLESKQLLQQSQEQVNSIKKELEDTQRRLDEVDQIASQKENSNSQDTRALKKLLEKSQFNERALQDQLRQTKDNFKKITEDFGETKIKFREKSKAKDKELNPLLHQSQEHVNRITHELEDAQTRLKEVNQKAQMTEKSLSRKISDLQEKINAFKLKNETVNDELQQTREDLRKTTNDFEEERKRLIEGNHRASETDKSSSQDTSDMRKLLDKSELNERALKQQLRDTQDNLKKLEEQFAEIKTRQNEALHGIRIQLNDKIQEVSDLKNLLDISKSKEVTFNNQIQQVQDTLQITTAELEDTKTRLSKLMGQKLTDNNPNITDLSDKNRPTKLGERFSELYDNEWTDAFEVLWSISKDERTTVITLFTILKDADKYCREEADKQMERIRKDLTLNMETGGSDIPNLINKQLKDFRKALATEAVQHLFEVYTKELSLLSSTRDSAKSALRVEKFLREAFTLCWLMAIQDPPVVFNRLLQHGEKFNTELYRSYTKAGPLVDFTVWPTMFLHKGGPVLYKGVAQGCHK